MTPKFLCEEAARLRGMAATVDREASKARLLTMASSYESEADAAEGSADVKPIELTSAKQLDEDA